MSSSMRCPAAVPLTCGPRERIHCVAMTDEILDRAALTVGEMLLVRAGKHVVIRVGNRPLMSSDVHDSEGG